MEFLFIILLAICGTVTFGHVEELPFWDLKATKKWNSTNLPKHADALWNLGLSSYTCAIQKQKGARIFMEPAAHIAAAYFSAVELYDSSSVIMQNDSLLDLKDQSQFIARETASVRLERGVTISLSNSRMAPGFLTLLPGSKLDLSETKFQSLLSTLTMQQDSVLKSESRSQITFIGGSHVNVGKLTSLTLSRTFVDVHADLTFGQRCQVALFGVDFTAVGGAVTLGNAVEFKADNKAAFTVFGANITFQEGAKFNMSAQAEFNMERPSSLFMARRDLRLRIEERALFKIGSGAHCLMTGDLTVPKQTRVEFNGASRTDSFRCFDTPEKMNEEKRLHFPD